MSPSPDASLAGEDFCYVTTTGRVTGKAHTIEIWFALNEGVLYVLMGDGFRADTVRNLQKLPSVRLKLGGIEHAATARVVSDASEDALARHGKQTQLGEDLIIGLTSYLSLIHI